MQILREPDRDAALQFLAGELQGLAQRRGHLITAVGDCEVSYQGRATSTLTRGERLLLLKPDGTLLVHTPEKAKPVNWQPPGAAFSVAVEDGKVVLTSHRTKPEEIVRIVFHRTLLLVSVPLKDNADLAVTGTEDDLQALLHKDPQLVEDGFVPAMRERDTDRGYHDLDGRDAKGRRLIVELKRTTAGVAEAQQLWRYVEAMRKTHPDARGMLVAPRVAEKARNLLRDHALEWKEIEWADVMPKIEAMRRSGQTGLGRFG